MYETDLIHLYDDKPIAFSYAVGQEPNLQLTQRRSMMKVRLILSLALLLICTGAGAALAQGTPDWMTPSEETICDSESGAAYGLCNAYCEAMDCNSPNAQASATACSKVKDKFTNITGRAFLPCESCPAPPPGTPCPCTEIPEFNEVLNNPGACEDNGVAVGKVGNTGPFPAIIAATCSQNLPSGGGCGVLSIFGPTILNITPEEGSACAQLILDSCNP